MCTATEHGQHGCSSCSALHELVESWQLKRRRTTQTSPLLPTSRCSWMRSWSTPVPFTALTSITAAGCGIPPCLALRLTQACTYHVQKSATQSPASAHCCLASGCTLPYRSQQMQMRASTCTHNWVLREANAFPALQSHGARARSPLLSFCKKHRLHLTLGQIWHCPMMGYGGSAGCDC